MHPSELVLKDGKLIDLAKLFEHGPEIVVFEVAGNLSNKQLDCIVILLNIIVFAITIELDRLVEAWGRIKAHGWHTWPHKAGHQGRRRLGHEARWRQDVSSLQL